MIDALAEDPKRSSALPEPPARAAASYVAIQLLLIPLLLGAGAWAVQHGPLDMALARHFADPATQSFEWRHSAWLDILGHHAARGLPIIVGGVALAAGIAGFFIAQLRPWQRILLTLGAAMIAGPLLISMLKTMTTQHCPSALSEFGGVVSYAADRSAPFWAAVPRDAGHCMPSGHSGGGYALFSLYFAGWAAGQPAWRWRGLAIGIAAGLLFSVVRMMQGAHFASATLWSAAVAWGVAALFFLPLVCRSTSHRP